MCAVTKGGEATIPQTIKQDTSQFNSTSHARLGGVPSFQPVFAQRAFL